MNNQMKNSVIICEKEEEIIIYPFESQIIEINDFIQVLASAYTSKKGVLIKAQQIVVDQSITLNLTAGLSLISQDDIIFKKGAIISNSGSGSLYLKSGIGNSEGKGKVIFEDISKKQVVSSGGGKVYISYNPDQGTEEHKYHNPFPYFKSVEPQKVLTAFMLVNNVKDLQDIKMFLHGNYALSRDINATETKHWNNGKGFEPLSIKEQRVPFSGDFDGNGYSVSGLYVNRPQEKDVGLFGIIAGQKYKYATISNLNIKDAFIHGDHYVGCITGDAEFVTFDKVNVTNIDIYGRDVVGGFLGTAKDIIMTSPAINPNEYDHIHANQYKGLLLGSAENTKVYDAPAECEDNLVQQMCVGYSENLTYQ